MPDIKNKVVIIGRPNTGKSTLFNVILHEKKAITSEIAGTTRDIISAECQWSNKYFTLFDTAGLKIKSETEIETNIQLQAEAALKSADVIIFVVDIRTGPTPQEINIADQLRKKNIPVILAINKSEGKKWRDNAKQFDNFGFKKFLVSSIKGVGVGDLLDEVAKHIKRRPFINNNDTGDDYIKIGILGKPNAGKSFLLNRIIGKEKVLVSEIPGTTRDAIDIKIKDGDSSFIFFDTAGIKRQTKIKGEIDKFSISRSFRVIKEIDIALLVIDASEPVTKQDLKIADRLNTENKGIILIANKWDLVLKKHQGESEQKTLDEFIKYYQYFFEFLYWAPIIFVSAKSGQNIDIILPIIKDVYNQRNKKIDQAELDLFINKTYKKSPPPKLNKKKPPQIINFLQIATNPPVFKIIIAEGYTLKSNYIKFIGKELRKSFGFEGTGIKIIIKHQ